MPTILVADDSIAVRKVAERLLTEAGMGVALAANGVEALAYLSKERPDAIVSDVIMPDKSGYEVCAFVRGNAILASIPVLLISGIVNDEVTKQADTCRADGVLKKPFQGTSLKDRVLELLAKRQDQGAAPHPKPTVGPAAAAPVSADKGQRMPERAADATTQAPSVTPKEVEERLGVEQRRADTLAKRVAELEEELRRAKTAEALLVNERQRATDLEARIAGFERQASQVPELEAALMTERAAAEQLVEQLADMDKVAARTKELEAALTVERSRVTELNGKLATANQIAVKVQELETLLGAERDRNALLTKRVSESEQVAESATKRFEDMARKLGEIAGLASQLGKGK